MTLEVFPEWEVIRAGAWVAAVIGLAIILAKRTPPMGARLVVAGALMIAVARSLGVGGHFLEARLFNMPAPMQLFSGCGLPLFISATFLMRCLRLSQRHRTWLSRSLVVIAISFVASPIVAHWCLPVELKQEKLVDGVCLQTHSATCAPAAATTFLRQHGIDVTENEMVMRCLTSRRGTEPRALLAALESATRHTRWRVTVESSNPSNWNNQNVPKLALVHFEATGQPYEADPSWWPEWKNLSVGDTGHVVVVNGKNNQGQWVIADPAFGVTYWSEGEFQRRFTGDAVRLSPRVTFASMDRVIAKRFESIRP